MDSYDSRVTVQQLPKHLADWEKSNDQPNKMSANQSNMYWAGMIVGLIVSLSVALPASVLDQSIGSSLNAQVYNSSSYFAVSPSINRTVNHYQLINQFDVPLALGLAHTVSHTSFYRSFNHLVLPYLTLTNILVGLAATLLGLMSIKLYTIIMRPLMFDRPLTKEQREIALRRSYPDMPPAFPNAWFRLCNDFDLNQPLNHSKVGYKPFVIDAFDHQFTIQRSNNQTVSCIDETGREWEVCETNRIVFIWHDVNGRASSWQVPHVQLNKQTNNQIINDAANDAVTWKFVGATSHEIMCHIQEIPENGADTAHLDYLHGSFILDWLTGSVATHTWDASWQPGAHPNQHLAKIGIDTAIALFNHKIPGSTVQTRITQVGPGIVQLLFPIPHFGNVILQETITPIHANLQRATHVIYCQQSVPKPIAKLIMKSTLIQFERDFIVWNSKRWIRSPLAVKEDGPILKYRRWMKQFFDEAGGELIRDFEGQSTFVSKLKH